MNIRMLLLAVLATWSIGSEVPDDIKDVLNKRIEKCNNDQICCSVCTESDPCIVYCIDSEGNESTGGKADKPCSDDGSIIAPNLRYRHTA